MIVLRVVVHFVGVGAVTYIFGAFFVRLFYHPERARGATQRSMIWIWMATLALFVVRAGSSAFTGAPGTTPTDRAADLGMAVGFAVGGLRVFLRRLRTYREEVLPSQRPLPPARRTILARTWRLAFKTVDYYLGMGFVLMAFMGGLVVSDEGRPAVAALLDDGSISGPVTQLIVMVMGLLYSQVVTG